MAVATFCPVFLFPPSRILKPYMYILLKSTVKLRHLGNVYGPIGQVQDYMGVAAQMISTFEWSHVEKDAKVSL